MPTGSEKYILAVDLGTSGPKVALVSVHGKVVEYAFEAVELFLYPHGGAEQRPADWWNGILRAAKQVLAQTTVPVEDIVAVNCTGQWSGTVAVDGDGQPLMNAVIWMDSRGSAQVRKVAGGPVRIAGYAPGKLRKWLSLTGGAPGQAGKDPLAHILHIKATRPEIYRRTDKFLEPTDYINLCLTGRAAASFDSITLHWVTDNRDIHAVRYDAGLLSLAGIERDKLPDLMPPDAVLGTLRPSVAEELGLSPDVKVLMGAPDVPCAAVGSGGVLDFESHLYIGTSSWLVCHVPFKKTDLLHNIAALPSAIPGRYFTACEQETAGACLTFLRDNLFFPEDGLGSGAAPDDAYPRFDRVAAEIPAGADKLIFTPWLYGERTPVEDHLVRSCFFNQSLKTTRAHQVRAVLEGVAYNMRWLHGCMEKFVRRRLEPIRMIGGGANSALWCQIHADVLGRTIRQVADPIQANVRGAAFLAAAALGYIAYEDIAGLVDIAGTYRPNPDNAKLYTALYREFLNIYKANRKIFARLNRS